MNFIQLSNSCTSYQEQRQFPYTVLSNVLHLIWRMELENSLDSYLVIFRMRSNQPLHLDASGGQSTAEGAVECRR